MEYLSKPMSRRGSVGVSVGGVIVGGGAPIVVQSMTNTDTADIDATVQQVAALAKTAIEFPPMQKGASFNLEAVKDQIEAAIQARHAQ